MVEQNTLPSSAAEPHASEGRVVTFYSYKGGTGRSMAMANVSWLLALAGFKVLVIDWDLEAPGLHRYFRPFLDDADLLESDGLIDFVMHFAEAASEQPPGESDPDWYKAYSNLLPYAKELKYDFPGEGTLDFIPAGRQNGAYAVKVNSFNWKHFYEKLNGGQVLDEARRILKEEYDYILIDSRTGVSDTAGICTVQMPDDLVVFFTLNLQSVLGVSSAAASVVEQRVQKGSAIRVFPIPTRVDYSEKVKTDTMKLFAKPRIVTLLPAEMTDDQKDKYWAESDVPYVPFYAFEENLAYFRDQPDSPITVLAAMIRIASRIAPIGNVTLPRLDPEVKSTVNAAYDSFSGTGAPKPEALKAKPAVYLSVDNHFFRHLAANSTFEVLTWERFEKARVAVFIMGIGAAGLTELQRNELAIAEKLKLGPIYTVLLPGAHPESLPRLLLPYPVIGLQDDGSIVLPDPSNSETLEHLPVAPYPGLNPFTASDGPIFFARGDLIDRLLEAVTTGDFVAVVGPPHSGRTSLVQAGLIPKLAGWTVRSSFASGARSAGPSLVVMDAKAFASEYVSAIPDNTSLVVIAETAEEVTICEQRLGAKAERIDIPRLTEAELMAAINEPAARARLAIDPKLAPSIVTDLKEEKAQLPLLQYLMSELYSADPKGELSLEKYLRLGGVLMVERKCDSVFTGSNFSSLSRLAFLAEDGSVVAQDALEAGMKAEDHAAIEALIAAEILAELGGSVRFANQIFLDRWTRLRQWLADNREFLLWRQRLLRSLAAWETNPRPFTLLSGDALTDAQKWIESREQDLNEKEIAYIRASTNAARDDFAKRDKAKQEERGRLAAVIILSVLLGLGSLVGWLISSNSKKAKNPDSPAPVVNGSTALPSTAPAPEKGFASDGWCYQETASAMTRRLGLTSGYGAYCNASVANCKAASTGSPTASQCAFVEKMNLQTWGGVKPTGGGYLGSWYRRNLPRPLPLPFPQPAVSTPAIRDAQPAGGASPNNRVWCYQKGGISPMAQRESPQQQQNLPDETISYDAYCYPAKETCILNASGSRSASACEVFERVAVQNWPVNRAGDPFLTNRPNPIPPPFPQPVKFPAKN